MNKADLVAKIAEQGVKKVDAEKCLNAMIDVITEALKNGEKVTLMGFGTFEVRSRAARTGRNPRTNEVIEIPASKSPAFKAGRIFKDAIK